MTVTLFLKLLQFYIVHIYCWRRSTRVASTWQSCDSHVTVMWQSRDYHGSNPDAKNRLGSDGRTSLRWCSAILLWWDANPITRCSTHTAGGLLALAPQGHLILLRAKLTRGELEWVLGGGCSVEVEDFLLGLFRWGGFYSLLV